jgi:hypothetical protein
MEMEGLVGSLVCWVTNEGHPGQHILVCMDQAHHGEGRGESLARSQQGIRQYSDISCCCFCTRYILRTMLQRDS